MSRDMLISCGIQWLAQVARYFSQAHLYLKGTSWLTSVVPLMMRLSAARTRLAMLVGWLAGWLSPTGAACPMSLGVVVGRGMAGGCACGRFMGWAEGLSFQSSIVSPCTCGHGARACRRPRAWRMIVRVAAVIGRLHILRSLRRPVAWCIPHPRFR